MRKLSYVFVLFAHVVLAQTAAKSIPGVFYVASYSQSGTHTDYDMAREAADAYANMQYSSGSVLVLKPGLNQTCDAVPLPSNGTSATTSIIGSGSSVSSLQKASGCSATAATLRHSDSPNGALSRSWYQGFTVDANHIDIAACEFYGMQLTTFVDIACGNAASGADHEVEVGNRDANLVGWMDNIYAYDITSFDNATAGLGGSLLPVWSATALAGVTVAHVGTTAYSSAVRAQLVGPDLATCSTVPTLFPVLTANGQLAGASVTNGGACKSTTNLFILVQDGTPVTYGLKFTNIADSHLWNLNATGQNTYGIGWLLGSNNNSVMNEQMGPNQWMGLSDNANGNRHTNPLLNSPGEYAVGIFSQNGTVRNPTISYLDHSYVASAGYYLGNNASVYQDWTILNSTCNSYATPAFLTAVDKAGVVSTSNLVPAGVKPQSVEACDGTSTTHWPVYGN